MTDKITPVPDHLLERLAHHSEDKANTAFARSTMREALGYLREAAQPEQDGICPHCGSHPGDLTVAWMDGAHCAAKKADEELHRAAELLHAIREGAQNASSDDYFKARPQIDTGDRRRVFESGFLRGYDAAIAAEKQEGEMVDTEQEIKATHAYAVSLESDDGTYREQRLTRFRNGGFVIETWTSVNGFTLFTGATHWTPLPAAPTEEKE